LSELNTTPLIDVMLVLLIMFIMTIPIATNSLDVDVGAGKGVKADPVRNLVDITPDNRILWNGAGISKAELLGVLHHTRELPVEPELQFRPDGQANYALALEVTNIIKGSGVTKFGFVGNEQFAQFDRAAGSSGPD